MACRSLNRLRRMSPSGRSSAAAGGKVVEPEVWNAWMSRCVTRAYTRVHEC
jgi:hypothetical protein